jgi:hypothetical protein
LIKQQKYVTEANKKVVSSATKRSITLNDVFQAPTKRISLSSVNESYSNSANNSVNLDSLATSISAKLAPVLNSTITSSLNFPRSATTNTLPYMSYHDVLGMDKLRQEQEIALEYRVRKRMLEDSLRQKG